MSSICRLKQIPLTRAHPALLEVGDTNFCDWFARPFLGLLSSSRGLETLSIYQQKIGFKRNAWDPQNSWCRLEDSNPRPIDYKSIALPTELSRPICVLAYAARA